MVVNDPIPMASEEALRAALHESRAGPTARLGDVLLATKSITQRELEDACRVQSRDPSRRLGEILVSLGLVTPRAIQMALSEKLGIPFVDALRFPIQPATLELVDSGFAQAHQVLPLLRDGDTLVVAMENPLAEDLVKDLQFRSEMTIVPVIAGPEALRARITQEYLRPESLQFDAARGAELARFRVEELATQLANEPPPSAAPDVSHGEEARISDNVLVRLINRIIMEAHAQGASDIHIESNPGKQATHVRFRKDGDLEHYLDLPPAYRGALVSRIKIMAGLDIAEHRHGQDGKINFSLFGPLPIELRVAVVPTSDGLEDVVLRLLGGVEPLPLQKLGLAAHDLQALEKMITRSYGLILVCGPTGSGKTTTLHSVLHHINRPDLKIWTAEDPVEISQQGLRQVQVQPKIGWTFAAAMRSFLRADPDVIMVGEMRDAETTNIGIQASLTGHLVFSTLHTNSAAESVVRLLDLGMDPFNFADALIGILSQRLARKLCDKCKRPHPASPGEIEALLEEFCSGTSLQPAAVLALWRQQYGATLQLYEPAGCPACRAGYKGRTGVYELLSATEDVKQLVRTRGTVPQIVEAARNGGMRLLRQDAIEKVLAGVLDRASARAAAT
jgi:type II secretory ATPase GspE/PulE/Tfp pilus assembly ATPase PilB-like protein